MFARRLGNGRWTRALALGAAAALVTLASHAAVAARGGKTEPVFNGILVFGDGATDAIRSDGSGPYDVLVEFGRTTLETGKKRGLEFDFSRCVGTCEADPSGLISDVDLVALATGTLRATFSAAGGNLQLLGSGFDVQEHDDDGDGTVDRYVISDDGSGLYDLYAKRAYGWRGHSWSEYLGTFRMPWSATVSVD